MAKPVIIKKKKKPRRETIELNRYKTPLGSNNGGGSQKVFTRDEVIDIVAKEMAMGMKKYELKRMVTDLCGRKPSVTKFEQVLTLARCKLREAANVTRDDAAMRSITFYLEVSYDRSVDMKDRLKAMERIDSVLGLDFRFRGGREAPDNYASRVREFLRKSSSIMNEA